jgi:hypothetical protein
MKRLLVLGFVLLGSLAPAKAQDAVSGMAIKLNAASDFSATSAAQPVTNDAVAAPVAAANVAAPADMGTPAEAAPAPQPRFLYGGRDDYRFQLGIGFAWTRFRSPYFNASAVGVNTSLAYYTNDWFAVEGSVSSGFAPVLHDNEHVKLLFYGAGPKIAWRQRRWEPWAHALFGGIHEQPQIAQGGRNGFSIQAGGGADYRLNPRLSGRLQVDWLRTSLFGGSQNNFQATAGVVLHF